MGANALAAHIPTVHRHPGTAVRRAAWPEASSRGMSRYKDEDSLTPRCMPIHRSIALCIPCKALNLGLSPYVLHIPQACHDPLDSSFRPACLNRTPSKDADGHLLATWWSEGRSKSCSGIPPKDLR